MIAITHSIALDGAGDGTLIDVETDMKQGLPGISIVGMGNKAITEARERLRSALKQAQLPIPPRKFVINLAPAELPKDGAQFDLALAVSVLIATGHIAPASCAGIVFAGELSLDGHLKAVHNPLAIIDVAASAGMDAVFLPEGNASLAATHCPIPIYTAATIRDIFLHLKGITPLTPIVHQPPIDPGPPQGTALWAIAGLDHAKRALQIAVAGHHPILLSGPPGVGKSMLARALPSLMPSLSPDQQVQITKLHGSPQLITAPPFRSPSHLLTRKNLLEGTKRMPGEVTLAHHGVLYFDELPEFKRETIEALRAPLEQRTITLRQAQRDHIRPAHFLFAASMNPCPCGYFGDSQRACVCSAYERRRYEQRLSGPLQDRIHIHVSVPRTKSLFLQQDNTLHKTQHLKVFMSILNAKVRQQKRYKSSNVYNASLSLRDAQQLITVDPAATYLLETAASRLDLSPRASLSIIAVAQTIADLEPSDTILPHHVSEALQLRSPLGTHKSEPPLVLPPSI